MLRNRLLAIFAVVSRSAGATWGQGGATGAISGTVQDVSGAVIQNAKVKIERQPPLQSCAPYFGRFRSVHGHTFAGWPVHGGGDRRRLPGFREFLCA